MKMHVRSYIYIYIYKPCVVLYTNIHQTLLNFEIGGLSCCIVTTEYRTHAHCIHRYHLFCNTLVHVIYLGVSGQCSYTIKVQGDHNILFQMPEILLFYIFGCNRSAVYTLSSKKSITSCYVDSLRLGLHS